MVASKLIHIFLIAFSFWTLTSAQEHDAIAESQAGSDLGRGIIKRRLCKKHGICQGGGGFGGGHHGGFQGGHQSGYGGYGGQVPPINIAVSQSQAGANGGGGYEGYGSYPGGASYGPNYFGPYNYQFNNPGHPGGHGGHGGYGGFRPGGYGGYNNQFNGNYYGAGGPYQGGGGGPPTGFFGGPFFDEPEKYGDNHDNNEPSKINDSGVSDFNSQGSHAQAESYALAGSRKY